MNDKITVKNKEGQEKEYDIILTFTKNDKNYITYTDYSKDEDNNINCYSKEINDNKLLDITDEDINKIIDTMLLTITEAERDKFKNKLGD